MKLTARNLNHPIRPWIAYPLLGVGLLMLGACSTTQKADVVRTSSFLGADVAKLSVGSEDQAGRRYLNPAARWGTYKKAIIAPVEFWGADNTKIPPSDQKALVDYFTQQLNQELGKKFEIVNTAGPGVLKIAVAMTDAEAATPVLRSVSMIIPQAHMVSNLKYLATGSFPFVGAAQAEGKVSDSATGQVLAAFVDKQIGGGALTAGFQWQWGDAENAITDWSKRLADKLASLSSGAVKP